MYITTKRSIEKKIEGYLIGRRRRRQTFSFLLEAIDYSWDVDKDGKRKKKQNELKKRTQIVTMQTTITGAPRQNIHSNTYVVYVNISTDRQTVFPMEKISSNDYRMHQGSLVKRKFLRRLYRFCDEKAKVNK